MDGVHDVGGVHDADGGRRSGASVVGRRERDAVDAQRQRLRLGKRRGRDSRGAPRARRRGTAASHGDSAEHQLLLASFRGGEPFLEGDALVFGDAAVVNLVVGARHHRAADKPVRLVLNVKDSLGPALGRHELLSPELGARDHGLDVLGELLALHDDRRAFVRERGALLAESEVEASEVIGGGLLGLDPRGDDPRVQHRRGALVLGDADGALVEEGRLGRDDVELHVASVRGGEDAVGEAAGDCLGLAGLFQRDRLGAGGGVGGGELAVGQLALALLRGSLELAFELRREFSLVEFSVCDWGMRCESSVSASTRAFLKLSKYTCRFAVRSQPFSQSWRISRGVPWLRVGLVRTLRASFFSAT